MSVPETCLRCGHEFDEKHAHWCRGLCRPCWGHARRNKNLEDWPRLTWSSPDLVDEVRETMSSVADREADIRLCQRIGTTPGAVSRAAYRLGDAEVFRRFERAHQRLRRVKARA